MTFFENIIKKHLTTINFPNTFFICQKNFDCLLNTNLLIKKYIKKNLFNSLFFKIKINNKTNYIIDKLYNKLQKKFVTIEIDINSQELEIKIIKLFSILKLFNKKINFLINNKAGIINDEFISKIKNYVIIIDNYKIIHKTIPLWIQKILKKKNTYISLNITNIINKYISNDIEYIIKIIDTLITKKNQLTSHIMKIIFNNININIKFLLKEILYNKIYNCINILTYLKSINTEPSIILWCFYYISQIFLKLEDKIEETFFTKQIIIKNTKPNFKLILHYIKNTFKKIDKEEIWDEFQIIIILIKHNKKII
ncbi:MAG: hypothetical protein HYZ30_00320 [Candidatus Azosocius agrarius]|nr:MAG: hypothetical protein HYZ30_00320 [Gammaproteobacteria bacterium]